MRRYRVMYRLDAVLVEVKGVRADSLTEAIEKGRDLCLMKLTRPYKGMTVEHADGRPRVVGVERADAWQDRMDD